MKVRSGEDVELNVTLNDKEQNSSEPNKSKGLLPEESFDYPLGRRLKGGINFYDLQLLEEVDIYKSHVPDFVYGDEDLVVTVDLTPPITRVEKQLEDEIFLTELEQWKDKFFKLDKIKNQARDVELTYETDEGTVVESLFESEKFTEAGLKLSGTLLSSLKIASINGNLAFDVFDYDFSEEAVNENIKVTSERDIEADPVSFSPSSSMDIFLVPSVISNYAQVAYTAGFKDGDDDYPGAYYTYKDAVNHINSNFPRELYNQYWEDILLASGDSSYQKVYKKWQIQKQWPDVRLLHGKSEWVEETPPNPPFFTYLITWTTPSISTFPYSPIYTSTSIVEIDFPADVHTHQFDDGYSGVIYNVAQDNLDERNKLVMVIKKGSQWFYFWRV